MVYILVKGGRSGTGNFWNTGKELSHEEKLHKKIDSEQLTDSDINEIVKGGDAKLLTHLDRAANDKHKMKKNLDNKYGEGLWDGVDKKGNLFKDIDINNSTI